MAAPPATTGAMLRRILPLQVGALLIPLAGTGMVTLIPRLVQVHELPVSAVGLAITVFMIPFATAQLFAGGIAQRFTPRPSVLIGYGTFVVGSIGCAAAPTFTLFLVFRLLQAVGSALLFPVLMALVGEVVPAEQLGRAFGAFTASQMLGMALGPLVAGFLEVSLGWRSFFAFLALLAATDAAWFMRAFKRAPRSAAAPAGVLAVTLRAIRDPAVVMLSLSSAGLFFSVVGTNTYLAVWLKEAHGLTEDVIGMVLAVHGAVGIPTSPLAGKWGDASGRKRVALFGLAGYLLTVMALGITPYALGRVLALVTALGVCAAVTWTSLGAMAVELRPALRQPVTSVYNAFRFFGYSLAPPLLGLVYTRGQVLHVWMACALVIGASAACAAAVAVPAKRDAVPTA